MIPLLLALAITPQKIDDTLLALRAKGLNELGAFSLLTELTQGVGNRISGSPQAAKAVEWGQATMNRLGFDHVGLVPCKVPHWSRGSVGKAEILGADGAVELPSLALGFSSATPKSGLEAEVVEVHSLAEAKALGDKAKGKIVFYNGPMDRALSPGAAYGTAGAQRFEGPAVASKIGAAGVLVRSMTQALDDVPHTGVTVFGDAAPIPAAAISTLAAEALSKRLKEGPVRVRMTYDCQTLPDEMSANVEGEILGSEHPEEVIIVGGHLDSWDVGQGANDDGAGVVQSLEALRLIKEMGIRPKRTIRAVLFMSEENGSAGAKAYAANEAKRPEKVIAGIESDDGGFTPRAFSASIKPRDLRVWNKWLPVLSQSGIERFNLGGGGGADVGPLGEVGAILIGLEPDNQRYFDYHHTRRDVLENVHPRELEMGATAMASLALYLSEHGR